MTSAGTTGSQVVPASCCTRMPRRGRAYHRDMTTSRPGEAGHDAGESVDVAPIADLLGNLGHEPRLVILQHLQTGEHRVVDLNEHLGLSQSTVSWHLARLREAGLVTSRSEGRASFFSLRQPEAVAALLAAAHRLQHLLIDGADAASPA